MFRYFGPPGTGKTTTLINQVEKALAAGVLPNQIGFFARSIVDSLSGFQLGNN